MALKDFVNRDDIIYRFMGFVKYKGELYNIFVTSDTFLLHRHVFGRDVHQQWKLSDINGFEYREKGFLKKKQVVILKTEQGNVELVGEWGKLKQLIDDLPTVLSGLQ